MPVRSKLLYLYAIFLTLYAASSLIPRPIGTVNRYDLTTTQYWLLSLSVVIPIALIWYAAIYGYSKLRGYSDMIQTTPDGKHVSRIATGVMVLAFGLPVSTLISSYAALLGQYNPELLAAGTIIKNYASLSYPLIGFIFISQGTRGLSDLAKQRATYRAVNTIAAIFIAISVVYCALIIGTAAIGSVYHMNKWLVLATIVTPYLFTWYLGLSSAYELHLYSRKAPGKLYRKTWNMLATGLGAIIVMQITFQYIGTATVQLQSMQLARLLLLVYVLLVLLSVGYLLVALGAKRLRKIEEV